MTPGEIATLRRRAQDADAGAEDNSEDLLAAVAEIERLLVRHCGVFPVEP